MPDNTINRPIIRPRRKSPGRSLISSSSSQALDNNRHAQENGIIFRSSCDSELFEQPHKKMKKCHSNIKELKNVSSGLGICCKLLFLFLKLCMLLFLIASWVFTIALWYKNQCNFNAPVFRLQISKNVSECVIGQDHSIEAIQNAVDAFEDDIVSNPDKKVIHLMWWVGTIGVGKTMTSNILAQTVTNVHIVKHIISSTNHPDDSASLARGIVSKLHCCKVNVVIIDGYNTKPDSASMLVENVLYQISKSEETEFSKYFYCPYKILIIVSGIYKSNLIIKHYLYYKHYLPKEDPRGISSFDALALILKDKFKLIDEFHHIRYTTVVPFFPLEFTHMDKCILQILNQIFLDIQCSSFLSEELQIILKNVNLTVSSISSQIMQTVHKYPSSNPILLSTGCKSLSSKIRLIINLAVV